MEKKDFVFTLSIEFKGVIVNSHFFDENKIEFDIYPKEISSPKQRCAVFEFMQLLSKTFERTVSIKPENSPDSPFISISPNGAVTIYA